MFLTSYDFSEKNPSPLIPNLKKRRRGWGWEFERGQRYQWGMSDWRTQAPSPSLIKNKNKRISKKILLKKWECEAWVLKTKRSQRKSKF